MTDIMGAKFSDIVGYFEKLAKEHVQIKHSEKEKHFYRLSFDEALTGLKEMNFPAMIIDRYGYRLQDQKSDNVIKDRELSFMLISKLEDPEDFDAMHTLWDSLEDISDDIVSKIKADKRNRNVTAVMDFDLNSVEVDLVSNKLDSCYGVITTLTISSPKVMDVDGNKWNLE